MRSPFRAGLVLILTAGLLAFFLRSANWSDVWAETSNARGSFLLLAIGTTLTTYLVRAFRWQYLLAPIGPTKFWAAFETTVIGFSANFLLPARPGEVLRPYLLARREHLAGSAAFATIILERLLDLVTVLLLFGVFVVLVDPATLAGDPALYTRVKFGGLISAGISIVDAVAAGSIRWIDRGRSWVSLPETETHIASSPVMTSRTG